MGGLLTGPTSDSLQRFFIPSVCLLISFLGYSSQWLFNTAENLEPGPMTQRETTIFNILLFCVWSTYYKACTVPPGRYLFPETAPPPPPPPPPRPATSTQDISTKSPSTTTSSTVEPNRSDLSASSTAPPPTLPTARWCKKCNRPKPLRAHHCRSCGHCIPKMDHHCPWTGQCVSLQTFPHFLRFLVYTTLALAYLHAALLYPRLHALFTDTTPAHLGPRVAAMVHLVLLAIVGGVTSLLLLVLLVTTVRGWLLNQTMIEGWELERHEAVLARARRSGGYWHDGTSPRTRIDRIEFPYDLSFFENMAQAMGTRNPLAWLDPFIGRHPVVSPYPSSPQSPRIGWEWDENGFNDRPGMWPPPDPDKLRRGLPSHAHNRQQRVDEEISELEDRWRDPRGEVAAFRARQELDSRRRGQGFVLGEVEELEELGYEYVDGGNSGSGGGYDDDEEEDDDIDDDDEDEDDEPSAVRGKPLFESGLDGEPGWTNAEGDRLRDYGVDEDAEDDDDDVPLGELLRRRKAFRGVGET
ncbi:unnamed protein product [Discula destructiva]